MDYSKAEFLRSTMLGMFVRVTCGGHPGQSILEGRIKALYPPYLDLYDEDGSTVTLYLKDILRVELLGDVDYSPYTDDLRGLADAVNSRTESGKSGRPYSLNTWVCLKDRLEQAQELLEGNAPCAPLCALLGDNAALAGHTGPYDRQTLDQALEACASLPSSDPDMLAFLRAVVACTFHDEEKVMESYLGALRWDGDAISDDCIRRLALPAASHAKMMSNDCGFVFFVDLYLERFGEEIIRLDNAWWLHYLVKCVEYQHVGVIKQAFRRLENAPSPLREEMYRSAAYLLGMNGRTHAALEAAAAALQRAPEARSPAVLLMSLPDDQDTFYFRYKKLAWELLRAYWRDGDSGSSARTDRKIGYIYDYVFNRSTAHIISTDLNSYFFNNREASDMIVERIQQRFELFLGEEETPEEVRVSFETMISPRKFNHRACNVC